MFLLKYWTEETWGRKVSFAQFHDYFSPLWTVEGKSEQVHPPMTVEREAWLTHMLKQMKQARTRSGNDPQDPPLVTSTMQAPAPEH